MEKRAKTVDIPLPRTPDGVLELVKHALGLPLVTEIKITTSGISVTRTVYPDEEVLLPLTENAMDFDDILGSVDLVELEFQPDNHPYLQLYDATRRLVDRGLTVTAILAPDPDTLSAFLGLEEEEPEAVFGIRVIYMHSEKYPDKLVVVGGPTSYLLDLSNGVVIDIGE